MMDEDLEEAVAEMSLEETKADLTRFFHNRTQIFDFLTHLKVFFYFFIKTSPIIKKSCYLEAREKVKKTHEATANRQKTEVMGVVGNLKTFLKETSRRINQC